MGVDSDGFETRECRAENPGVGGSIPSQPTMIFIAFVTPRAPVVIRLT
jgi:hypothetical protein